MKKKYFNSIFTKNYNIKNFEKILIVLKCGILLICNFILQEIISIKKKKWIVELKTVKHGIKKIMFLTDSNNWNNPKNTDLRDGQLKLKEKEKKKKPKVITVKKKLRKKTDQWLIELVSQLKSVQKKSSLHSSIRMQ